MAEHAYSLWENKITSTINKITSGAVSTAKAPNAAAASLTPVDFPVDDPSKRQDVENVTTYSFPTLFLLP